MTDRLFSVALHIGAHKTATTHLQQSIAAHGDAILGHGVRYFGPEHLRKPGQSIPALLGLAVQGAAPPVSQLRRTLHRLVLSEENYIGPLNAPRRKTGRCRYPDAAARIDAVAQALGQKVDVFLAIRRPTGFLNAAYCQQLMGGGVIRMADYLQANPLRSVDWHDLVLRLRAAPGIGQLVVWCHEDYATHFPAICAGLLGTEAAQLVRPLDRHVHRSLSAAAVAEVLHRHAMGEKDDLGQAARRLLPVEDGYPPFDGFSPAYHAAGDTAYRAQVVAIGAIRGVTLLDPHWAQGAIRA